MRLTIKAFRLLRKAAKGVASGHHHLLEKVDEKLSFTLSKLFTQTNHLCAVGEQCPASSWFFPL